MFFVGYAFTTASQVASRRTIGCVVRKSTRATSVDRDIANVPVATYIPVHVHTYMTYIHTIVDMTHTYIHTDTYIHTHIHTYRYMWHTYIHVHTYIHTYMTYMVDECR